jgi:hypothetical protein
VRRARYPRQHVAEADRMSRPRSRLGQALVCPYCRDGVGRRGAVACARRGCGALYHRECWGECAKSYGGCAIYGCGSAQAHEVGLVGYLLRAARLVGQAFLSPPRMARRLGAAASERIQEVREVGTDSFWKRVLAIPLLGALAGGLYLSEVPFLQVLGLLLGAITSAFAVPLLMYAAACLVLGVLER